MRDEGNLDRERLSVRVCCVRSRDIARAASLLSLRPFLFHLHPKLSPSRLNPFDSCQAQPACCSTATPEAGFLQATARPGEALGQALGHDTEQLLRHKYLHGNGWSFLRSVSAAPGERENLPKVSRNSVRV